MNFLRRISNELKTRNLLIELVKTSRTMNKQQNNYRENVNFHAENAAMNERVLQTYRTSNNIY